MGTLALPAMVLQDASSLPADVHVMMWCDLILTGIAVVLLLGLLIGALVVYGKLSKLAKQVERKAEPLLAQTTPLIGKGKEIAAHVNDILSDLKPKISAVTTELEPKIASISSDVQHISSVVRSKVDEAGQTFTRINQTVDKYNDTAQDVNTKARGQVARVNEMVSEALTTTQHVSKQVQHGIKVPVEKVASWIAAAKIGMEQLAGRLSSMRGGPRPGSATPRGAGRPNAGSPSGSVPGPRIVHSAVDDDVRSTPPRNVPPTRY